MKKGYHYSIQYELNDNNTEPFNNTQFCLTCDEFLIELVPCQPNDESAAECW